MCGRFAFYSPSEATAALFGVDDAAPVEPRYNIAPTQYVAAIRDKTSGRDDETEAGGGRELRMLRWGLVPFWARDPSIGNRMINARAETVAEKPAFRAAYRKRRCLILADGFYEWRKEDSGKVPYFISAADGEPFAFAGLWESWRDRQDEDDGQRLETATILTMAANDFMSRLHDRMPVVVRADGAARWLGKEQAPPQAVAADRPSLRAWPVSRTVNNARNEGAELIGAVADTLTER